MAYPRAKVKRGHRHYHISESRRGLLLRDPRPTCIIYPDGFSALGGLAELGRQNPGFDDASLMGYDGARAAPPMSPKLTTFRQNTEQIGKRAVTELLDAIARR